MILTCMADIFYITDMEGFFMSKDNPGLLRISEDVVVTIATAAINEIKGVECIRPSDGFIRNLFFRSEPVNVRIAGDVVEINADVVVKQGYNAVTIAERIQESVKSDIQSMTGIAVSKVNVLISGVSCEK